MLKHFAPQSNTARDVLEQLRISEVWSALGGGALRHGRGRAWWRDGDGWSVSLDDAKGAWFDFPTGAGGGILDLIILVRGGSRADALRWCADLAGIPLDDKPFSAEDRARWAAERRLLDRELPEARLWRRAAIEMSEELLDVMKVIFFTGPSDRIDFDGIRNTTNLLSRLRRIDGPELVTEFQSWGESHPGLTSGMVRAAKAREQAERRALVAFLGMTDARRCAA